MLIHGRSNGLLEIISAVFLLYFYELVTAYFDTYLPYTNVRWRW